MSPEPLFADRIATLRQALVVPERAGDRPLASGVLDAEGRFVALSQGFIRARKPMPAPRLGAGERVTDLPGRHLYAGHLRGHFGHFLVESTARLWALDQPDGPIDSVLFLPYRGDLRQADKVIRDQAPFLDRLCGAVPARTVAGVTRVETLVVPELGFGWAERYAGAPAYRAFLRDRLGRGIVPEGGERLYISRARLIAARGGVLGERVIETNLERQGYEVFHPERHPLEVQIARYKAARRVVALDGSALHLAAFFLPPGARVAIIQRRSRANVDDYRLQFRSFCAIDPVVIDAIRRDWVSADEGRIDYRSVGELDFVALFGRLAEAGMVAPEVRPDLPDAADLAAMLDDLAGRRGAVFRPVERDAPEGRRRAD
jgi:hypothetical protein